MDLLVDYAAVAASGTRIGDEGATLTAAGTRLTSDCNALVAAAGHPDVVAGATAFANTFPVAVTVLAAAAGAVAKAMGGTGQTFLSADESLLLGTVPGAY